VDVSLQDPCNGEQILELVRELISRIPGILAWNSEFSHPSPCHRSSWHKTNRRKHLAEPKKNGGVCLLNPHDVGIGSEIIKGDSKPERVWWTRGTWYDGFDKNV